MLLKLKPVHNVLIRRLKHTKFPVDASPTEIIIERCFKDPWGIASLLTIPICLSAYAYARQREHMLHERFPDGFESTVPPGYELNIIRKDFPWGDGKTSLFTHYFGKPGGHH